MGIIPGTSSSVLYRQFPSAYEKEIISTGETKYANPFAKLKSVTITSGFGMRKFTEEQAEKLNIPRLALCHPHFAIDFSGENWNVGLPLLASENGRASVLATGIVPPDGSGSAGPPGDPNSYPIVMLSAESGNTHYYSHMDGTKILGNGSRDVLAGDPICTIAPWIGGTHLHWIFVKKGDVRPSDVYLNFISNSDITSKNDDMKKLSEGLKAAHVAAQNAILASGCKQ